mgnify:CR=1 FL=1
MSLKGAGSALLIVLMKKKPAVAFISVPSVSYGEIFDMGAMPPVLSMPLGIMYLSSSLKRSGSASNIFHVDYIVEASKLHAAVEDNEEEIVKKYNNNKIKTNFESQIKIPLRQNTFKRCLNNLIDKILYE